MSKAIYNYRQIQRLRQDGTRIIRRVSPERQACYDIDDWTLNGVKQCNDAEDCPCELPTLLVLLGALSHNKSECVGNILNSPADVLGSQSITIRPQSIQTCSQFITICSQFIATCSQFILISATSYILNNYTFYINNNCTFTSIVILPMFLLCFVRRTILEINKLYKNLGQSIK